MISDGKIEMGLMLIKIIGHALFYTLKYEQTNPVKTFYCVSCIFAGKTCMPNIFFFKKTFLKDY